MTTLVLRTVIPSGAAEQFLLNEIYGAESRDPEDVCSNHAASGSSHDTCLSFLSAAPQAALLSKAPKREAKNPENVSSAMQCQGVLTRHSH